MRIFLTNLPSIPQELSPLHLNPGMPPLGLGFLAAHLKRAGHEVFVHDNGIEYESFRDNLKAFAPDFVGISVVSVFYVQLVPLIDKIRTITDAKILCGGPHATLLPETIPDSVAHIVRGEGEHAVLDIIEGRATSRIVEGGRIDHLDELAFPDMKWFADKRYRWYYPEYGLQGKTFSLNTSRGCPFDCAFCSVKSIWGKQYRMFSAEKIADYIEKLVKEYQIESIFFREDNFTAHKARVIKLFSLLKKRDIEITWACESRVDSLDKEYLEFMYGHGLRGLFFGIESGSQRMLDAVNKGITLEKIEGVFELCKEIGIITYASMIYGLPGETEADRRASDALLARIRPHMHSKAVFIGIPKSRMYDEMEYYYQDKNLFKYPWGYESMAKRYFQGCAADRFIPHSIRSSDGSRKELLSILIISCDRLDKTKKCVQSILNSTEPPYEILILDNASRDKDVRAYLHALELCEDSVRVFYNEENIGCGPGRKMLTQHARGEYILTLDNDMEVAEGWLEPLISELCFEDVVGVCPLLVEPENGKVRGAGICVLPQVDGAMTGSSPFCGLCLSEIDRTKKYDAVEVDYLFGGAMLFKREALTWAQYTDDYFVGYNDFDFCNQLKKRGVLKGVPRSVVYHYPAREKDVQDYHAVRWNFLEIARSTKLFYERWGENFVRATKLQEYVLGKRIESKTDLEELNKYVLEDFDEAQLGRMIECNAYGREQTEKRRELLKALLRWVRCVSKAGEDICVNKYVELLKENLLFLTPVEIYSLASLQRSRGEGEDARELFFYITERVSDDPLLLGGAWFHLGCIALADGEREQAYAWFEKCLFYIPDHRKANACMKELKETMLS